MKLLKIEGSQGLFLAEGDIYSPIDKIRKEDLLRLVDLTLREEAAVFDEFDDQAIKNQAHQIIYKSIATKLASLRERRQAFIDESARLYLEDYDKYRKDT